MKWSWRDYALVGVLCLLLPSILLCVVWSQRPLTEFRTYFQPAGEVTRD